MDEPSREGLTFDAVDKRFGGVHALKSVSLRVGPGEIVALLGENGAGKSTLIKILGGVVRPSSGRVLIDGAPYHHRPGAANARQPVAFIHQDLGLIEWMTVAENMALAQGYPRRRGLIDWAAAEKSARRALALVACDFDPATRVAALTRTEKSLVAIARALAVEADYLVLDEPTASLPADEVERLFAALRPLRAGGVGMIYVSHRLDEVFRIADRVAVLRDGALVGERAVAETDPDDLVGLIVGGTPRAGAPPPLKPGPATLTVRGCTAGGAGPVDFEVRAGELMGLVGLRGAGHEAVGRALFGDRPGAGAVMVAGVAPDLSSPGAAMAAGIGLVARDRVVESVAPALSVRENAFINPLAFGRRLLSFMGPRAEAEAARAMGARVGLRPNDPGLAIEALSGGNQQKVVVARWLGTHRRLLIAEDPTAGVDVGAKAEIYALLFDAVAQGMGVLVVSTDFEEVAAICHRALVFSRGAIVAELAGGALNTPALIHAASTGDAGASAAA